MKIGKPVAREMVNRGSERWAAVVSELDRLAQGMALPVTLEDKKEISALQTYVYSTLNHRPNGKKYFCSRREKTLYIMTQVGAA